MSKLSVQINLPRVWEIARAELTKILGAHASAINERWPPGNSPQITIGTGLPDNAVGADGDFHLRSDGTVGANTVVYHKEAGAWVAFTTT